MKYYLVSLVIMCLVIFAASCSENHEDMQTVTVEKFIDGEPIVNTAQNRLNVKVFIKYDTLPLNAI